MNKVTRILIVIALIVAVCGIIIYKHYDTRSNNTQTATQKINNTSRQNSTPLPRLLELGSDQCIPCKMMAPILEELKKEYEGRLRIDFIDVWKDPDHARTYGIRVIPTQIFYDETAKELYRHEGFMSKEDILAKWKELGFDFDKKQ